MEDMGESHFPPGTKPFKCPTELGELGEVWEDVRASDATISIKFEKGWTVQECMRHMYHSSLKFNKKRLNEAWCKKRDSEAEEHSKEPIVQQVLDAVKDATSKDAVELDGMPEVSEAKKRKLRSFVEELYEKIAKEIQDERTKERETEEKERKKMTGRQSLIKATQQSR